MHDGDAEYHDGAARIEQPELHRLLCGIADAAASVPHADLYPQVIKRAAVIRRRRRAMRASSVTAVLVAAALLAPSVAHHLGMRGGAAVAEPPAAVVDLTSAYPAAEPADVPMRALTPAQPANALDWAPRGDSLPDEATDLASSYLLDEQHQSPDSGSASVTTLWAGVEDDTTAVAGGTGRVAGPLDPATAGARQVVPPDTHKTWLFVMQGWTVGPDGAPSSPAQLLIGEYRQSTPGLPGGAQGAGTSGSRPVTSMTVHATPIAFAHPRPGSGDDKDDTDQIAELSVWLPDSGRLLVLGAPQTKTVLYAKTGGDLIPQKTVDGVALFPRTKTLVKGHYADTIQVRDAKNVALTPPKAWSAGDFALTGPMDAWVSTTRVWTSVEAPAVAPSRPASEVPSKLPAPAKSTAPAHDRGRTPSPSPSPSPSPKVLGTPDSPAG